MASLKTQYRPFEKRQRFVPQNVDYIGYYSVSVPPLATTEGGLRLEDIAGSSFSMPPYSVINCADSATGDAISPLIVSTNSATGDATSSPIASGDFATEEDTPSVSKNFIPLVSSSVEPTDSATNSPVIFNPVNPDFIAVISSMLEHEDFESGVSNPSEDYFREFFESERTRMVALCDILSLFMSNYSADGRKANILVGILHMLSHFSYEKVFPFGQSMAVSALTHIKREVNDFGIKCFENWGHPNGIEILRAARFHSKWLQEYADAVIAELSEGN